MATRKTLVKLKGEDAALVLRANGEVELVLPPQDQAGLQPDGELALTTMHLAAVSQLFQTNDFSQEIWKILFARMAAVGQAKSPIILPSA